MPVQLSGYETNESTEKELFELTITKIGRKSYLDVLNTPTVPLRQAMDNSGPNGAPLYLGWAPPNTPKNASSWRICKLTYSNNRVTDITWADGTADFTKKWDDRTTYSYLENT